MKNIKTVRVIGVTPLCAIFILLATGSLVAQENPSFQAHKEFSAVPPFTPGAPGVLAQGDFGAIDSLDVHTGKSHRLGTFNRKFPAQIHWSPDGRTLFANYEQTGANFRKGQIGVLSGTGGDSHGRIRPSPNPA